MPLNPGGLCAGGQADLHLREVGASRDSSSGEKPVRETPSSVPGSELPY